MKKLFVIAVIMAMGASSVFAAGQPVEKPDLPDGYQNWPYKFSGTCQVDANNTLKISMFVTINTAMKESERMRLGLEKLQAVLEIAVNGTPTIMIYRTGDPAEDKPAIARDYLYTQNIWVSFGVPYDFQEAVSRLSQEKLKKDLNEVIEMCPDLLKGLSAFNNNLQEKMRK